MSSASLISAKPGVEQLSFLLNAISHAVLYETLDKRIVFINQNFCTLFKVPVPAEMLIGTDCSQAAAQSAPLFKYPAAFLSGIDKVITGKEVVRNELLEFADGLKIYRDYYPAIDKEAFSGHIWIYKNSLELTSILSEVENQKNFFENLLHNIPADIAIFDKTHHYQFINRIAISTNDTPDWLIGKTDYDFCKKNKKPTTQADIRRAHFNEAVQKGQMVEFEEINETAEGKKVFNLRRFYPLKLADGSIDNVIGYGINISNIREREEELFKREQSLQQLVDSMDQLVITINKQGIIRYANAKWCKTVSENEETNSCIGADIASYFPHKKDNFHKNLTRFIETLQYATDKRQATILSNQQKRHTLNYYFSKTSEPITKEELFLIFFNDITLQLKAENELRTIAKEERKLNELKSNFVSMVSHELRTPLSVILSSAELLDYKISAQFKEVSSTTHLYTNRIIEQVDKMTNLMNDFLFLSKLESGNIPLKISAFNLIDLVNKLNQESYSPYKDGRILELSVKGNPTQIQADYSMLSHCISNIITNAFKYSPDAPNPSLRIRYNKKHIDILVLDHGIGISTADKQKLFQPFVRGSNVKDIEGTGLGLITVKYFVKKNKGKIFLKSIQGKGTVIKLQFPYN